jgi:phosphopentomutase
MGLGHVTGRSPAAAPVASWGRMRERSAGNDSTNGHWEIAGAVVDEPFATFQQFPEALVAAIEGECGVRFLGNRPASGTAIVAELGAEHVRSGRPILYTSADSVLQIAAHEDVIPTERLYAICRTARRHADAYRIGRVIARPFVGSDGAFRRTAGRHDFSMAPPRNLLDALADAGIPTLGVGKTGDLFAGRGLSESHPTGSNAAGMEKTAALWDRLDDGLLFTNLVDFDMLYGHRRDADGFARALAELDDWLCDFLPRCRPDDLFVITADHGNDPTFRGTDHTREEVPLLVHHAGRAVDLGIRETFADAAATLAEHLGVANPGAGRSFLGERGEGPDRPTAPRADPSPAASGMPRAARAGTRRRPS